MTRHWVLFLFVVLGIVLVGGAFYSYRSGFLGARAPGSAPVSGSEQPTTPPAHRLFVVETNDTPGNQHLQVYDADARTLAQDVKEYGNDGALTSEASQILLPLPPSHKMGDKYDDFQYGEGHEGTAFHPSIYPDVKDRIGKGIDISQFLASPDGKALLFSVFKDLCGNVTYPCRSPESTSTKDTYVFSITDKSMRPLAEAFKNFPPALTSIGGGAWSPDGQTLYLIPFGKGLTFYAFDWRTQAYKATYTVTPDRTILFHEPFLYPLVVSHDGKKIALSVAWRGEQDYFNAWQALNPTSTYSFYSISDLYLFDVATGKTTPHFESSYEVGDVAWSPDDGAIAAHTWLREPEDIESLEVFASGNLQKIWSAPTHEGVANENFSPDSRYLIYRKPDGMSMASFLLAVTSSSAYDFWELPTSSELFFRGWR